MAAYDAARRPATAAVVAGSRQRDPGRVLDLVEERAANGFTHLDEDISQQELEEVVGAFIRTAGSDRELVNQRPSLSVG